MAQNKKIKPPFYKDWRHRKIIHRTPGGKLTRVKISSLPADEQQKYNPNRFKRTGADTRMTQDQYLALQRKEIEAGQIFDFYIQVKDESELESIEPDTLLLATTDGTKVPEYFDINDDMIIMKLKTVPMDAVKSVAIETEDGSMEFEDIADDIEGQERYEKIKFNDVPLYQIDIADYLPYIEKKVDMDTNDDTEITESFYNFYYTK